MRLSHRTRTRLSLPAVEQAPGISARVSSSNWDKAASGERSSAAAVSEETTAAAKTIPKTRTINRRARRTTCCLASIISEAGSGGCDFHDMHLRESIRAIQVNRSAGFGAKHAVCHAAQLL